MTVLVVTGTGTGVGKTITTAALAAHARQAGLGVTVCKPVQTGIATGDDDLAEIGRLTGSVGGIGLTGLARYPRPLAPVAAARLARRALPTRSDLLDLIRSVDAAGGLTLVEGAGGLLVELSENVTLADIALELAAPVLVVAGAELGTVNHTALTLEALDNRRLPRAGLVIGSWPAEPDPVHHSSRSALERLAPVRAVLPADAGALSPDDFAAMAAQAFDRSWVGSLLTGPPA